MAAERGAGRAPGADADALARRCADEMWAHDKASQALGMRLLEVAPGAARMDMVIREDMLNGQGICHGGILFALADSTFAFACNSYDDRTLAQGCSIEYMRPASLGQRITARARERSRGRRTGVYDVELCDEQGRTLALMRGKAFATGKPMLPA